MADRPKDRPVCHRDGSVSYWSPYQKRWIERDPAVRKRELVAMDHQDQMRVQEHLVLARNRPRWRV